VLLGALIAGTSALPEVDTSVGAGSCAVGLPVAVRIVVGQAVAVGAVGLDADMGIEWALQ
jgi:hypothetical protein